MTAGIHRHDPNKHPIFPELYPLSAAVAVQVAALHAHCPALLQANPLLASHAFGLQVPPHPSEPHTFPEQSGMQQELPTQVPAVPPVLVHSSPSVTVHPQSAPQNSCVDVAQMPPQAPVWLQLGGKKLDNRHS